MALLWIEGFEGYGATVANACSGMGARYYGLGSITGTFYVNTGRVTGYSGDATNSGATPYFITPPLTTDRTLVVGGGFYGYQYNPASPGSHTISFYDNSTLGISVQFSTTGTSSSTITVKMGATTLLTFTDIFFLITTWYYFEVKVYCHATAGSVEVRVNGATVISLTDIDTKAGIHDYNNVINYWTYRSRVDDVYICDGSGSAVNDFQGTCRVLGLFPNGDTSTIQWTPSTGVTHYNLVDENPASATDYVSSNTQQQVDLYGYPQLVGSTGSILGIQINSQVNVATGASTIIESPIVSNGVTEIGPDTLITSTSYWDARHISMTDPNTGLPWTADGLAAAQIGIKIM